MAEFRQNQNTRQTGGSDSSDNPSVTVRSTPRKYRLIPNITPHRSTSSPGRLGADGPRSPKYREIAVYVWDDPKGFHMSI